MGEGLKMRVILWRIKAEDGKGNGNWDGRRGET